MESLRDAFGKVLVKIGKKNKKIVCVSCDLKEATRMKYFFNEFKDRSIEVGIAEANAIGIASGLALSGFRPIVSSFGAFITGKNVEIRTSISYNNAPVIVVGTHGGLIGPDGATQSALQDVAIMRTIPGFKVFQPSSPIMVEKIFNYLSETDDMAYVRIARNEVPEIYEKNFNFTEGLPYKLTDGNDIAIFSSGPVVHSCLEAAKLLKNKISVSVIDVPSIKPLNHDAIIEYCNNCKILMTVEDHDISAGLGGVISEIMTSNRIFKKLHRHGLNDEFIVSGKPKDLEQKFKLNSHGIVEIIESLF